MLNNETKSALDNLASAIDEKIHKAIDDREIQAKKSSFGISEKNPYFKLFKKDYEKTRVTSNPLKSKQVNYLLVWLLVMWLILITSQVLKPHLLRVH